MTFAQPIWIFVGLIVCLSILFLLHRLQSARRVTLEKFAAAHLVQKLTNNVSPKRQTAKKILLLLALFSCFLSLARPQYGFRWEDIKRKGIDILFAVDTSKSMLARDIKPDRLERAKYAIMDFVSQLDGDRVGLLPFAGTAYLMCPLTGDYRAFDNSLKAVDTSLIPKGGTNIAAAIKKAETVLNNEANYKLLILITDGENLQGNVLKAAKEAAAKGLRIYTVGVGTREGEIIPITSGGQTRFLKDSAGNFVVSHLDEATLTQIAKIANGVYVPLGNKGQGLQTIYQQKLSLVPKQELAQRRHKVPLERFQWPLAAAILFFSLDFIIGTRKTKPFGLSLKKLSARRKSKNVITGLLLIFSLCFLLQPVRTFASEGEQAYKAGDYQKASIFYDKLLKKHPDDPKLQYNYGTASYKNKKFDEAIAAFTNALKTKNLKLQEEAYYNRGNALYRKGQETLKNDSQTTLAKWQQAVDSYNASLELNKNDKDALFNRNLVKRKIEELKKQQQKQRQNNHPEDKGKQQENKHEKKGKQQSKKGQGTQNSSPQKGQQQKKKSEGQQGRPESATKQQKSQKQTQAHTGEAQNQASKTQVASKDRERLRKGQMSKEDAEQLLNSLKDEEGRLNFVPNLGNSNDNEPKRDW
jgi:Ca-activated chloride channel family protein